MTCFNFNSQKEEELLQLSENSNGTLTKILTDKLCELARDPEVDVNCCSDLNSFTPLMLNCCFNKCRFPECFKALIENETINVTITDGEGSNALHLLCFNNPENSTVDVIKQLVQRGIDVKFQDSFGYNALHYFCKMDSYCEYFLAVINYLVADCHLDVNTQTNDGETALTLLCGNAYGSSLLEGVKLLVEKFKSDVKHENLNGENALHILCHQHRTDSYKNGQHVVDCIQLFVDLGIDPNLKTKQGDTALNLLCQSSTGKGLLDCVRVLVEKLGLHPDCKNENGENSLHCLFKSKLIRLNQELIRVICYLIAKGADKNAKTINEANTPMHCLLLMCKSSDYGIEDDCSNEDYGSPTTLYEFIRFICLEEYADIHSTNGKGENFLHLLTQLIASAESSIQEEYGDEEEEISEEMDQLFKSFFPLLEGGTFRSGIDLNSKTNRGQTALHIACSQKHPSSLLIKFLIEKGIDIQAKDIDGYNALHLLCRHYQYEEVPDESDQKCFRLLIESGIRVKAKTNDGDTMLHILFRNDLPSIFVLCFLIKKKIDVRARNKEGETALHLLCRHCECVDLFHMIRFLVNAGTDIKVQNNKGLTAAAVLREREKGSVSKVTEILQLLNSSQ